jgi:hypothetical protein
MGRVPWQRAPGLVTCARLWFTVGVVCSCADLRAGLLQRGEGRGPRRARAHVGVR